MFICRSGEAPVLRNGGIWEYLGRQRADEWERNKLFNAVKKDETVIHVAWMKKAKKANTKL
jgi:hypothetical protein